MDFVPVVHVYTKYITARLVVRYVIMTSLSTPPISLTHTHTYTPVFRIIRYLGSGQFGTVNLGRWQRKPEEGGEGLEVAVKMLKPLSKEEDKVKFLQEAAIMGQFLHPHVVKLHGVVTMGEPVRCTCSQ